MENRRALSRRTILQAAACGTASLAALPFLRRAPSAHAAPGDIRRLVIMFAPNEPIGREYWATEDEGVKGKPIVELASSVMAPVVPYKDRLRIIGDLTLQCILDKNWHADNSHFGILYLLTGKAAIPFSPTSQKADEWNGGPSVDKYIADKLGVGSLSVGVGTSGTKAVQNISYWDTKQVSVAIKDPKETYNELFANFNVPEDMLEEARQQRASVLDVVAGDLKGLSARLPKADRHKLDQHLTDLRALEEKLGDLGSLSCDEVPSAPSLADKIPDIGRRQIDTLVQGLACDVRRVVTLQYGNSGSMFPQTSYNWPNEPWPKGGLKTSDVEHEVAHKYSQGTEQNKNERRAMETFYYGQLRYLLDQLSAVDEGNGKTLLDSTLVMFVHAMGFGHKQFNHLFLFAGGDDFIQTGRFDSYSGEPHNKILAGVCRAMGVDETSYGDPDYSGYIDLA
jgi:hypothetical protein